jgi:hypothetical protein
MMGKRGWKDHLMVVSLLEGAEKVSEEPMRDRVRGAVKVDGRERRRLQDEDDEDEFEVVGSCSATLGQVV